MHSSYFNVTNELPMNCRKKHNTIKLSKQAAKEIERISWLWRTCRSEYGKTGEWLFGDYSIALDFPADPTSHLDGGEALQAVLGKPVVELHQGRDDWLVELATETEVRDCRPDMAGIAALPTRGLIVTTRGNAPYDFVSRFFGPAVGVDEDPVTGSAHCTLADYWGKRLGKSVMKAWQVSARGGRLGVRLEGERVFLTGQAVNVLRGELLA
jgi:predicted PhzF superfamily epimerase YddE/YHI9